jgi:hypothetical protein
VGAGLLPIVLGTYWVLCGVQARPEPQSWEEIITRAEQIGLFWLWDGHEDSVAMVISDVPITAEQADAMGVGFRHRDWSGRMKVYRRFGCGFNHSADVRLGRFDFCGDHELIKRFAAHCGD